MKFAFIAAEKAWAPVPLLCRVLEVSRSGFYAWQRAAGLGRARVTTRSSPWRSPPSTRPARSYGSPRVHAELRDKGIDVSRKRVARLMRELGIREPQKAPLQGHHRLQARPAGRRQHPRPEVRGRRARRRLGHGHHLRLDRRGLAVPGGDPRPVLAAGRGLAMSERIDRALVLEALQHGIGARAPQRRTAAPLRPRLAVRQRRLPGGCSRGMASLQHEPQGQLLGQCRRRELLRHPQDGAGLPDSLAHACPGPKRVFEYIEIFYNRRRRHSALGYLCPDDLNDESRGKWLLNPSVYSIGAISPDVAMPQGTLIARRWRRSSVAPGRAIGWGNNSSSSRCGACRSSPPEFPK